RHQWKSLISNNLNIRKRIASPIVTKVDQLFDAETRSQKLIAVGWASASSMLPLSTQATTSG
ncbi:MAG: hypothetical protein VXZ15_16025, partial [Planctomycetota bacterium]|nr:hypothetical protein [Planctomycetota bacterium]